MGTRTMVTHGNKPNPYPAGQVTMLMDLVCTSCGELMEDAVKKNMRIRVLASDTSKVRGNGGSDAY